ncbi:helix-turn-helix transcriptional regulator [Brevibacterium samyangense]|uniref:HTH cro/C1-type domain-containing protein n=1 Tax=Brevibacterium samyangense TaxID=366888 RepID=A0ABN2TLH3_9MICO
MPELDVGPVGVKDARKAAGLTQANLAEAVGVSRQTVISIERGDYAPSVYLALRIAHRLGTTVERLFPLDRPCSHPTSGPQHCSPATSRPNSQEPS